MTLGNMWANGVVRRPFPCPLARGPARVGHPGEVSVPPAGGGALSASRIGAARAIRGILWMKESDGWNSS